MAPKKTRTESRNNLPAIRTIAENIEREMIAKLSDHESQHLFDDALDNLDRLPKYPKNVSDEDGEPIYEKRIIITEPVWKRFLQLLEQSGAIQTAAVLALNDSPIPANKNVRAFGPEAIRLMSQESMAIVDVITDLNPSIPDDDGDRTRQLETRFFAAIAEPAEIALTSLLLAHSDLLIDHEGVS